MRVVVDNRLRCHGASPALAERLRGEFTRVNPQHMKLKSMGYAAHSEPYELKAWTDDSPNVLSLPRGGAAKLVEVASQHGVRPAFEDKRCEGVPASSIPGLTLVPRDYQVEIADKIEEKQNLIVRAGAGSGKTVATMLFVGRKKRSTLVVVHSNALRKQWVDRIESDMGIPRRAVGTIQGSKLELKAVTVGMAQTLAKLGEREWKAINATFGVLIQDEVHTCGAASFNAVVDRSTAKYRIGISDSERRRDGKTFLVYDQFGDVQYEIDHEELAAAGHVADVMVKVVVCDSPDLSWYRLLREGQDETKPDNQAFNRLISEIVADERRNDRIANCAANYARGHATLVFSQRVEHCRLLSAILTWKGIRTGLLLGGAENAGEFERTVRGLKDGTVQAGIGTVQAVGTGIDIPNASRGVVATPLGANKQLWRQVRGRLNRKHEGKRLAEIAYFHDPSAFGDKPVRNLRAWNSVVRVLEAGKLLSADAYLERTGEPRPFLISELPEWPAD